MRRINVAKFAACALMSVCIAGMAESARGEVMTFGAAKDATLIESATGALSAGGEDGIFAGRTGQGAADDARRALLQFNLGAIPAGSTINSVSLRLNVIKSPGAGPRAMTMHRLLGDWGEGTTIDPDHPNGGSGGPAVNGDATWLHQFRTNDLWTTPGGDFVAAASATTNVPTFGAFSWNTSAGLVSDVQSWLTNPASNFGWLIRDAEDTSRTARRFSSRENSTAANRPLLTIDFTPPPVRTAGDINNDGVVNGADVALLASSYGITTTANNFDLGEFSGDGLVGLADMAILQRNISPLGLGSPAAVPEPAGMTLICCGVCLGAVWSMRRMRILARR